MKKKFQVIIPASFRSRLELQEGGVLEAREQGGTILLIPQVAVSRKGPTDRRSLADHVGSARGLLSSVREIDEFIDHERKRWESQCAMPIGRGLIKKG
ncbi:MAG: AbrB/MazE/SpoVT family DNA-binding domain-containing protein [Gammaproteobacteria bacterium]|nr:AbrB/MazE/SpoVT family DNA-binding domain-containing protein [Gammaproteobacteria bacterium]